MSDDAKFELVLPFVVCQSQGGPFEDTAFVAGFQAGQIDRTLAVAAATEQFEVHFPHVHTTLLPLLALIGMNRGFPVVESDPADAPEWTAVTFWASKENLDGL